jgi:hypothetical protein
MRPLLFPDWEETTRDANVTRTGRATGEETSPVRPSPQIAVPSSCTTKSSIGLKRHRRPAGRLRRNRFNPERVGSGWSPRLNSAAASSDPGARRKAPRWIDRPSVDPHGWRGGRPWDCGLRHDTTGGRFVDTAKSAHHARDRVSGSCVMFTKPSSKWQDVRPDPA